MTPGDGAGAGRVGQPVPQRNGCLTALAWIVTVLVSGCVMAYIFDDGTSPNDKLLDRTEIASPDGKHVAILESFVPDYFVAPTFFYDKLTIVEGSTSRRLGRTPVLSDLTWLDDHTLRATLNDTTIPNIATDVLGVKITFHVGERANVFYVHGAMAGYEKFAFSSSHAGPMDSLSCELYPRNWQRARAFWAWAREHTDNGDPDPGPWVSKYYPADCSGLRSR